MWGCAEMQSQVAERAATQWAWLQLSLFDSQPEAVEAEQVHEMVQRALAYFEIPQGTDKQNDVQQTLPPEEDLQDSQHGQDPPKHSARAADDGGPMLDLDDESCEFFRQIGCRMLLTEMVVQSIRDMVLVRDGVRAERLKAKNEAEWEEVSASAAWLKGPLGRRAVQVLFPDWDHEAIIRRIDEDPQGVLKRFESWGSVSAAAREQGLSSFTCHVDWSRLEPSWSDCEPSWSG